MILRPTFQIALLMALIACADAQAQLDRTPRIEHQSTSFPGRLVNPYREPAVPPISQINSQRVFDLLRAGALYLSLDDAIALALENNLDIEIQRFVPKIADTELQRAKGGGLLRGLSLLVNQPPPGIGGPQGPLLTHLTSGSIPSPLVNTNFSDLALISEQQNSSSVIDTTPQSTGPPLPQFDPVIVGQFGSQHASLAQNTPAATGSSWLSQNVATANTGVNVGFSSGTLVSASFANNHYATDAARYTYNPFVSSTLGITITQPLLQGFGPSINQRFIRIARNSRKIADLTFRQQVMDTIAGVARLYTDLVSLREDLIVKGEAVRLAERLAEDNRNKVEQGTLAPVELTRANAALAASRQALIVAEGLVRQQELVVKTQITRRGLADPRLAAARIIPTTPLQIPEQEPIRLLDEQLRAALKNRPDLASAALQTESGHIGLASSRNALLPQLNVVANVQNSGLAGDLNGLAGAAPGDIVTGGYGSALAQVFRRNHPAYGIAVQLVVPLRNRIAQADAIRDELQARRAQLRELQLTDQIRLEVADAIESLRQARASFDAAVEARRLQEQSAAVERQTFDVGLSTNFILLQYENYLAQARSTEVASKGSYIKARIALQRAIGSILDEFQISLEEAYRGVVTRPPAHPDVLAGEGGSRRND